MKFIRQDLEAALVSKKHSVALTPDHIGAIVDRILAPLKLGRTRESQIAVN